MQETLTEFKIGVNSKLFMVLRDAAETMIKVCGDLSINSTDCFSHKLNLSIWDALRKNNLQVEYLLEKMKRFIRKIRKSGPTKERFENIQKLNDLPEIALVKDMEVNKHRVLNY